MISLFTSFQGRIGRGQWWLGSVILIVLSIAVTFIVLAIVGANPLNTIMGMVSGGAAVDSPEVMAALAEAAGPLKTAQWVLVAYSVVASILFLALSVKRRHDRNRSGIDVVVYVVLTLVLQLFSVLGIGTVTTEIEGGVRVGQEGWLMALSFASFAYFIYVVVVCGFLRGDYGGNNYGADPIDGSR